MIALHVCNKLFIHFVLSDKEHKLCGFNETLNNLIVFVFKNLLYKPEGENRTKLTNSYCSLYFPWSQELKELVTKGNIIHILLVK